MTDGVSMDNRTNIYHKKQTTHLVNVKKCNKLKSNKKSFILSASFSGDLIILNRQESKSYVLTWLKMLRITINLPESTKHKIKVVSNV